MGRTHFVLSFCAPNCGDEISDYDIDNEDQQKMIRFRPQLSAMIQFDKMAPFLIQKGIISEFRVAVIAKKCTERQSNALLKHLSHPDVTSHQLNAFIECLMETGHGEAAELIRPAANVSSFGSSQPGSMSVSERHLQVKRVTEPKVGPKYYKMSSQPRGFWLIINNFNFEGKPNHTRLGSDRDALRMSEVGTELGFDVRLHTDLTADLMFDTLWSTSRDHALAKHDAIFILIMSHGESDNIRGTDWPTALAIRDIRELFNREQCPLLSGKPKIFIFVTCRGSDMDGPRNPKPDVCTDQPGSFKSPLERSLSSGPASPKNAMRLVDDTLTAYSTAPGFVSHRNPEEGTYYITALARVLMEHSCDMDLQKMLRQVDKEMRKHVIGEEYMQTPCTEVTGFTKKLFFNPGHYDT